MPSNKQSNGKAASNYRIPFDEAVAECKKIIEAIANHQLGLDELQQRLGELADRVDDTEHGDRTHAMLAKAAGYQVCTLKRHLSAYRAWEGAGKKAPGLSYAVKRALQNHPEREGIVKKSPKITKREAQKRMSEWKQQHEGKQKTGKSGDWKANERRRWLNRLCSFANEHGRTAEEVMRDKAAMRALREIAEPALLTPLVSDLEAALAFAKLLQHPDEHIAKAERKRPHLKEAEREGVAA
jgi:hypothetical protein